MNTNGSTQAGVLSIQEMIETKTLMGQEKEPPKYSGAFFFEYYTNRNTKITHAFLCPGGR